MDESKFEVVCVELCSNLDRSVINHIKSIKDRMRVKELLLEYREGM